MRTFKDENGAEWSAGVAQSDGPNYKGRFHLTMSNTEGEVVELIDVRWNSERTAERTLETMGTVELRRRLRSARGRSAGI